MFITVFFRQHLKVRKKFIPFVVEQKSITSPNFCQGRKQPLGDFVVSTLVIRARTVFSMRASVASIRWRTTKCNISPAVHEFKYVSLRIDKYTSSFNNSSRPLYQRASFKIIVSNLTGFVYEHLLTKYC